MNKRAYGGFTIVELLIVIVVIAILATISVVSYQGIQERAYLSKSSSEMSQIAKAMAIYEASEGSLPPDVSQGIPLPIVREMHGPGATAMLDTSSWPGSYYDYEVWDLNGDGTQETYQISIRFCRNAAGNPQGENGTDCRYPRQDWASDFVPHSSVFYCLRGFCRAHGFMGDHTTPAYCVNCPNNLPIPVS